MPPETQGRGRRKAGAPRVIIVGGDQAQRLRNHVLACLERAALCEEKPERRRWLTFVVVGAGPTGVEFTGALVELLKLVLGREYPELPPGWRGSSWSRARRPSCRDRPTPPRSESAPPSNPCPTPRSKGSNSG